MNILISTSDPGDTNVIKHLVKKIGKVNFYNLKIKNYYNYTIKGSKSIYFNEKNLIKNLIKFLRIKNISVILLGLGHSKIKINHRIIKEFCECNIKVVVLADSFSNFIGRIKYKKSLSLPNKYLVSDNLASDLAVKEGIPKKIIKKFGNPVLYDFLIKSKKFSKTKMTENIIFVADPLAKKFVIQKFKKTLPNNKISEVDVFRYIYKNIQNENVKNRFYFICHPKHNYTSISKNLVKIGNNINVIPPNYKNKFKYLYQAKIIFGIGSIMLLMSRLINKNVISVLTKKQLMSNDFNLVKYYDIKINFYKDNKKLNKIIELNKKPFNYKNNLRKYKINLKWLKN